MFARFASISLFVLLAFASTANAQDISILTLEITGRDEDELNLDNRPMNAAECEDATVEITLRISGIDTSKSVLDFWRSTGTACNEADERSTTTDRGCTHLDLGEIPLTIDGQAEKDIDIPLNELANCETDGTQTIFVLAAMGAETTEDVGTEWGKFEIEVDKTPPSAPSGVRAGSGDTAITVSWDSLGMSIFEYRVYVDAAAGSCEATTLVAGEPIPAELESTHNTPTTSSAVNAADLGLAVGQTAAVGVAAVDTARNVSVLSMTTCLTRVETSGFCERFGECEEGCSVSSARHGAAPGTSAFLLCAAAALLVVRRRRSAKRGL